jgi:hypothetical protein
MFLFQLTARGNSRSRFSTTIFFGLPGFFLTFGVSTPFEEVEDIGAGGTLFVSEDELWYCAACF